MIIVKLEEPLSSSSELAFELGLTGEPAMVVIPPDDAVVSDADVVVELGLTGEPAMVVIPPDDAVVSDADVDGTMDVKIRSVVKGRLVGEVGVAPAEQPAKSA